MGISWHQHVLVLIALLDELIEENLHLVGYLFQFVTGEELQIYQHLIVT